MNQGSAEYTGSTSSASGKFAEVRCAVRFPLTLPVVLSTATNEVAAVTVNLSASGACFVTHQHIAAGKLIRFSLRMPGPVLATDEDVLVHCRGRVVRCTASQAEFHIAATIDEYTFADQ